MRVCACGSEQFERGATFHTMQGGTVDDEGKFTPDGDTTCMELLNWEDELCCAECGEEMEK